MDLATHLRYRLKTAFYILTFCIFLSDCYSQSIKPTKTFSYKKVDNVEIKADFFSIVDNSELQPVIIHIHGGGLIFGSKSDIPQEQLNFYLNAGYSLVSVDYRLAPETKLQEIVIDVRDVVQWVYEYGRDSLRVDPEKIFIIGHSGGAYLALVSGYLSKAKPRAIVSFYGYGDIRSEWYNTPDPTFLTRPKISEETARKLIRDSILTSSPVDERLDLYFYTRQRGIWPQFVTGHNPKKESEWFKSYCPIENIDSTFPPTLLIHGDKDTDVPFTESTKLKDKLKSRGIDHRLIQMKNHGHLFDVFSGGLANPDVADVFDKVIHFLNQYR